MVLPHHSTGSAVERAGYAQRISRVIAWPLLAMVVLMGFALSGWNASIPALIYDFQGIGAILCIDCQGDQALRRGEATFGTIQSGVDGMPVNARVAVVEADRSVADADGNTASESAGLGDSGDAAEVATAVAEAAKGATPPAKHAARPARRTTEP